MYSIIFIKNSYNFAEYIKNDNRLGLRCTYIQALFPIAPSKIICYDAAKL